VMNADGDGIFPMCDGIPASPPSNGSCYTIPPSTSSGGATACNPVTGAECTEFGSACDSGTDGYQCFPPPNTGTLCGACGDNDVYCGNGLSCFAYDTFTFKCMRYCCTDADCG
jgi:hypothetical protein